MKPIPLIIAVIIGIVITVFFIKGCRPSALDQWKYDTAYQTKIDTVHDSIPVPYQVLVHGKPVQVTKYDTIRIHDTAKLSGKDSSAIVTDYFVTRKYSDTLRASFGYAVVSNSVNQNKLIDQSAIFHMNVPTITKTNIGGTRKGYIGANAGAGVGVAMFGLDFLYVNKKDQLFRVKVDYTTLGSPFFEGGIATKIKIF